MTKDDLDDYKHELFTTYDDLEVAFKRAYTLIETMPGVSRIAGYTALHTVVNTIIKKVKDDENNSRL